MRPCRQGDAEEREMAIDYRKEGHIALVTMNRPEAMNCLNLADVEELGRVWLDFRDDDESWVAVLTGAGEAAFCAGADLAELIPKVNAGEVPLSPTMPAFLKNIRCFKPIIAAVNGHCLAGGMEMLQGTDLRISVEEATFGLPEVKLALFPVAGSTVRLPRQIPFCWAMQILLLGDPITARQALQIGLINEVVPREKLMERAMSLAERICRNGPLALKAIKESAMRAYDLPEEAAYFLEAFLAKGVFGTEDATEGPKAFLERRRPRYAGR
jgi:enoyl-CoA hydratase